jgi:hypothetical protein
MPIPDTPSDPDWLAPGNDLGGALLCDLSWPQGALKGLSAWPAKRQGGPERCWTRTIYAPPARGGRTP